MGLFRKHGRRTACVVGALLVAFGLCAAYVRFYLLGPMHRLVDPRWNSTHSEREYWQEVQESIRRTGRWTHNDGWVVGDWGDKSWAEWIMNRLEPDSDMGCGAGHTNVALPRLTNQGYGSNPQKWIAWWKKNKDKSQSEWIRDGFVPYGLDLEIPCEREEDATDEEYEAYRQNRAAYPSSFENPPTHEQVDALLTLLGAPDVDESDEADQDEKEKSVPDYVKYNAFRWLRDTGFDPVDYLLANKAVPFPVQRGLRKYAGMDVRNGLGVLRFNEEEEDADEEWECVPPMCTTEFQVIAILVVVVPLLVGIGLIVWSRRKPTNP